MAASVASVGEHVLGGADEPAPGVPDPAVRAPDEPVAGRLSGVLGRYLGGVLVVPGLNVDIGVCDLETFGHAAVLLSPDVEQVTDRKPVLVRAHRAGASQRHVAALSAPWSA